MLKVYTFNPFGYDGSLVLVETDLRRGLPEYNIVGIADNVVLETRERVRSAFNNSGLEFPKERILQSLSPVDIKKDTPMDLAIAVSILSTLNKYNIDDSVLVLGELELSGNIRPVRCAHAAVISAKCEGITKVICDNSTAKLLDDVNDIEILSASTLSEVHYKLLRDDSFNKVKPNSNTDNSVRFNLDAEKNFNNFSMTGLYKTVRAIEIAVAGKHNIITIGAPGCGKTALIQNLMPALTPMLTDDESKIPRRIASIAGLDSPNRDIHIPPFRMPHQSATIEGICGGGPHCEPGEISLAHNGVLFLDEAAVFRSSVLQMLRIPLESGTLTMSRAGRSTVYPAKFQLAMAASPCPCGCYGSYNKLCICSTGAIEQYWNKISKPLMDRVEIKVVVDNDNEDTRMLTIEEMKAHITAAFEIQRKRGVYNSHIAPSEINNLCRLNNECSAFMSKVTEFMSPREVINILKVSLTIANMDGRTEIEIEDIKEAFGYCKHPSNF